MTIRLKVYQPSLYFAQKKIYLMKLAAITTAVAISSTVIVAWVLAAALRHSVFFYTADGYMSPRTAVRVGLMKDEEASFSGGLAFRKTGGGGYDYREEMAIAFIDQTGHTDIDLLAVCERLGDCELRK
ncbi:hypothetical protein SAMN05216404_102328 [Nitrosospira multiformis]|nr:hypothetical protein [Nitrosospira multiformis]SEN09048.1 hypothetical protein SAMN05216404_102328 [Nitrosospira multiformis]